MNKFSRSLPPIVQQPQIGDPDSSVASPVCWAAALSSWLKAARNSDWTIGALVNRFSPFCGGGVSLGGSHLYILLEKSEGPAHAIVGYGVRGDSSGEYLGIMDPLRGVHAAPTFTELQKKAPNFLVGWAKH